MTEERFRAQFADATDLVTILNAAGVILYASASHEGLLGQTPADLEGRPAGAFMHPEDVPRMQEALRARVQANERPQPVVLRWRHVDGSWRWLEAMVTNKLHDPAVGGLIVIVTSRDITERRRAEERLMLQYAVSVILAGSATLDQAIPSVLQALCERNNTARANSSSSAICSVPSTATSFCCTISRASTCGRVTWMAPRRWCAGNTRSMASCCPGSSCPWPSMRG